jgi:ubiquinone/menaquinone biosynthesis C-methylase UbiE
MKNLTESIGIDEVAKFWNQNPLWVGESKFSKGSKEFFDEHKDVYIADCFAGQLDERFFKNNGRVLDLGCGIGFWLIEFLERNVKSIYGVDLSKNSLDLAERRLKIYGKEARLSLGNGEKLDFPDGYFEHVNCQGVIHHTVNPQNVVNEIYRVLKPGGTALISVYYKNFILRNLKIFTPLIFLSGKLGLTLKGRGRENMYKEMSVNEIIRKYDGENNPIGLGYTKKEFIRLIGSEFKITEIFYHFFPKRAILPRCPKAIHKILDRYVPFMIYGSLKKPLDEK